MSFPNMEAALWDWTEPMIFTVVQLAAVDYEAIETPEQTINFDAVLEPIHPRDLMKKPEGERKFRFFTMWTYQELNPGAIVADEQEINYRVMQVYPWRDAGYRQYELMQTPTPPYAGS